MFYTQVADGKLKKFVLCEACAAEKGITNPEGLLMAEELLAPNQAAEMISEVPSLDSSEKCLSCGFTLADLQKVGRLGCPDCYRAFSGEITQRLPSMHKGDVHRGYMPAELVKQHEFKVELLDLHSELDAAIDDEKFEEAARLRDRINELENREKKGATA